MPEAGIISGPLPICKCRFSQAGERMNAKRKRPDPKIWPFSFNTLVRLAGIEPTTPWFVAKYSIQLSYSRPMHAL
jgi:hypothetical protein